jgi:ATP/maltotriose-dependent transcriptional regulator MalT
MMAGRPREARLTQRQREVIALIAAGCSNDEVGERLDLAPTAKAHADTLRAKLGVSRGGISRWRFAR